MQYNKLFSLVLISGIALFGCGGGGGSTEPPVTTVTDSDNDGVADNQDAFPNGSF